MNAIPGSGVIDRLRLPRWLTGRDWPQTANAQPALARILFERGLITSCVPCLEFEGQRAGAQAETPRNIYDAGGALALPGLVDAHVHLDKTYTAARITPDRPGLLGAIDAMMKDRRNWTVEDIEARASHALEMAWKAGVCRLRTHVDWWEQGAPLAWDVLGSLAERWAGRIRIERVALIPQPMFADMAQARKLARRIASSGSDVLMGGFIHTHHWDKQALHHLLVSAAEAGLDLDLHVDEELASSAQGLLCIAKILRELDYDGRAVCGHVCALAAQTQERALTTLDEVARAPITLVSLPITNLLLQDAVTGRTPRQRGITLVKEARERDIPVLLASDNVEDPFCPVGSYDPLEAVAAGVLAAQLPQVFDHWSQAICRSDWLDRKPSGGWHEAPVLAGRPANFVLFEQARLHSWPSSAHVRTVLQSGVPQNSLVAPNGHAPQPDFY